MLFTRVRPPLQRDADAAQAESVLVNHIRRLRRVPEFEKSLIVLQIEANLGTQSDTLYRYLMQELPTETGRIVAMKETEHRIGGRTTAYTKDCQACLFKDVMHNMSMYFMNPLVTSEDDGQKMKNILFNQLGNYSKDKKGRYTGKIGNMQDDLCTCLMMVLYYKALFYEDYKRYGRWHRWNPT